MPNQVSGVPAEILNPSNQWSNKNEYSSTLMHLAELYKVTCQQLQYCLGWLDRTVRFAPFKALRAKECALDCPAYTLTLFY